MAVLFNSNIYMFYVCVRVQIGGPGTVWPCVGPDPGTGRGYADKYRGLGWPIHLIGVEFGCEKRNIVAFTVGAV